MVGELVGRWGAGGVEIWKKLVGEPSPATGFHVRRCSLARPPKVPARRVSRNHRKGFSDCNAEILPAWVQVLRQILCNRPVARAANNRAVKKCTRFRANSTPPSRLSARFGDFAGGPEPRPEVSRHCSREPLPVIAADAPCRYFWRPGEATTPNVEAVAGLGSPTNFFHISTPPAPPTPPAPQPSPSLPARRAARDRPAPAPSLHRRAPRLATAVNSLLPRMPAQYGPSAVCAEPVTGSSSTPTRGEKARDEIELASRRARRYDHPAQPAPCAA